jgi:hypothetical protein
MKINRKLIAFKVCICICLTFLCSSCEVLFTNPIVKPNGSKPDKRLVGKWYSEEETDKNRFVEITLDSKSQMNLTSPDKDTGKPVSAGKIFTEKIGRNQYLILIPNEEKNEGYLITRYKIENDELVVWLLDSDKTADVVRQGKLKGSVGGGRAGTIKITDSAENIKTFLESAQGDSFFKPLVNLKKIKETSK